MNRKIKDRLSTLERKVEDLEYSFGQIEKALREGDIISKYYPHPNPTSLKSSPLERTKAKFRSSSFIFEISELKNHFKELIDYLGLERYEEHKSGFRKKKRDYDADLDDKIEESF